MPDSVLVFDEGQNREERRTLERAHAQVLALETHGKPYPFVFESLCEIAVHRLPGLDVSHRPQRPEVHKIEGAANRIPQNRRHVRKLAPVLIHEPSKRLALTRPDRFKLGDHALDVLSGIDVEIAQGATKRQSIHRIKTGHRHQVRKPESTGPGDLFQCPGHHEEGRTTVKTMAFELDSARSSSNPVLSFENRDVCATGGQKHRGGQTPGAGPDNGNPGVFGY